MYETVELTTNNGDKIYLYADREPVVFEYADSEKQYVFCDDDSYAYTHGGVAYRDACDAITSYLATA